MLKESFQRIKDYIKGLIRKFPALWSLYWATKQQFLRIIQLRYFVHDIRSVYRSMIWPEKHSLYAPLAAELLFQYHKLEKGLVMPGPRRFFGLEPAQKTMELLEQWIDRGFAMDDPVFKGAIDTLVAYKLRISEFHGNAVNAGEIAERIETFISRRGILASETLSIQPQIKRQLGNDELTAFSKLIEARRSVRSFSPRPVSRSDLMNAVAMAKMSPSACNRQPTKIFIATEKAVIEGMLSFQNGNRGFGHLAPSLAVIAVDRRCYFDATERNQPYIDGSLFAMTFMYALEAHGLSTCCLNWCVTPDKDREFKTRYKIDNEFVILMLVVVGYAEESCLVPYSPRRDTKHLIEDIFCC